MGLVGIQSRIGGFQRKHSNVLWLKQVLRRRTDSQDDRGSVQASSRYPTIDASEHHELPLRLCVTFNGVCFQCLHADRERRYNAKVGNMLGRVVRGSEHNMVILD